MIKKISIIDYGVANIKAVRNALLMAGFEVVIENKPPRKSMESRADCYLLPGIGKFGQGISSLTDLEWSSFIKEWCENEGKLVGICLGMQLLCSYSEESEQRGLGLLDVSVRDITRLGWNKTGINMGWKYCYSKRDNAFLKENVFYFQHKYGINYEEILDNVDVESLLIVDKSRIVAGFRKRNIIGIQFHPEKSHNHGIDFLKSLKEWN